MSQHEKEFAGRWTENVEKGEYVLPKAIEISAGAAEKLIAAANADAALLYIYILRNNGRLSQNEAEKTLHMGPKFDKAMLSLRDMGLITPPKTAGMAGKSTYTPVPEETDSRLVKRPDTLPEYTSEDVKTRTEQNPEFAELVSEVQKTLGTVLSSSALIDLFGFYDYLGLPPDVILLMVAHCVEEHEKKYGEGKRPTMRVIRSEAYRWTDKGIVTLAAAAEYLRTLEKTEKRAGEIRRILGLKERSPSASEERYIGEWAQMDFDDESIAFAYDKTVMNTGRLAWKYMDSILKSWLQKGYHTISQVRSEDKKPAGEAAKTDEAGQEELERMKEYLKKLRES